MDAQNDCVLYKLQNGQAPVIEEGVQVKLRLSDTSLCFCDDSGSIIYQSDEIDQAQRISPDTLLLSIHPSSDSTSEVQQILIVKAISGGQEADEILGSILQRLQGKKGNFEQRTEQSSADLYFHYYSLLPHQQNMLQDMVRTGTYYAAITANAQDFQGKVVMDVGAGSGILSLFAAQAGAHKVYAVEASAMAQFASRLRDANPVLGSKIEVIQSKIEDLDLGGQSVDVLISEPMGTLLVNERMLETFLYARDHFLKQGGRMFPQLGRIHCAAFTDDLLHAEMANKATFWQQKNFFGVDVSSLFEPAMDMYFSQVVVDAINPRCLVSTPVQHTFDFGTASEADLHDIVIPLHFPMGVPGNIHGVACWFDVLFDGSTAQRWLSTAPGLPTTHWFQLRCVLRQPLTVYPGADIEGELRLVAHKRQSYDIYLKLTVPSLAPGVPDQTVTGKFDLKEPYYRQLTNSWWQSGEGANGFAGMGFEATNSAASMGLDSPMGMG